MNCPKNRKSGSIEVLKEIINCIKKGRLNADELLPYIVKNYPSMAILFNFYEYYKKNQETDEYLNGLQVYQMQVVQKSLKEISQCKRIVLYSRSSDVFKVVSQLSFSETQFFVGESRPLKEGIEQAESLAALGFQTTVVTDALLFDYISDADCFISGVDAIFEDYFVNKIGTRALCIVAKYYRVPVYVIGSKYKVINKDFENSFKILKEPESEICNRELAASIVNVYFEKIPFELITKLIL